MTARQKLKLKYNARVGNKMSSFKFQKHVLASSIAMVLAGASASAIAAEENAAANADSNIEVIEVTGIRGSNKKNLNAKRFSKSE